MTEQILLMNPRKGRMPAGLARYWASKRRGRKSTRRRRKSVRRARASNPRRRVRVHRRRVHAHRRHRRSNPIYARRRRRNPRLSLGGLKHSVMGVVIPGAIGAAGAVGLEVAWAYGSGYLPEQLKTGWGATGAKIGLALLLGYGASKVLPKRTVATAVVGAVTVIAANALRDVAKNVLPDVKGLGGYADYVDYSLMQDRNVGAYMPARLGFYNPAPLVDTGLGAYMRPEVAALHGYTDDGM